MEICLWIFHQKPAPRKSASPCIIRYYKGKAPLILTSTLKYRSNMPVPQQHAVSDDIGVSAANTTLASSLLTSFTVVRISDASAPQWPSCLFLSPKAGQQLYPISRKRVVLLRAYRNFPFSIGNTLCHRHTFSGSIIVKRV